MLDAAIAGVWRKNQHLRSIMKYFRQFACLFALLISGVGIAPAQIPVLSITQSVGQVILAWPQAPPGFRLESIDSFAGTPLWIPIKVIPATSSNLFQIALPETLASGYFRLGAAPLTTLLESSPANGETGVSVLRETIVRFTAPLSTNTLISPDRFYASAVGHRILSRIEIASDRRSATLFYLEPLPGGVEVTAVFDGAGLYDESGRPLDPDGDGKPGGVANVSFQTFNPAPLDSTAVTGHVFASAPLPGNGGTNSIDHPLAGVTITVDGSEQSLRTTTDSKGFFSLSPCPAGRFFVKIDGRTAYESQYPGGSYYPFVGKPWQAIAGKTNNLAGGTGLIYLPLIAKGTLKPVSLTSDTTITFPATLLATNPGLAGVSITIPANSLYANDGTRGGKVGIAPVSPDRLPAPLPPGVHPALVITVQTDGANNFDRPAPVRFPNLPDATTGVILPPGAKTALWSFNHKSGRWEIQGPMTVSADGHFVDSDPGYGIRQPGWDFLNTGNSGGGGGAGGGGGNGGGPPGPPDPDDPCKTERKALESNTIQCVLNTGIGVLATVAKATPGLGCAISAMQGVIGSVADCNIDPTSCKTTIAQNLINTAIGCVPVLGAGLGTASTVLGAVKSCGLDEALAYGNFQNCKKANGLSGKRPIQMDAVQVGDMIPNNIWMEQLALLQGVADVETILFGNVAWTEAEPSDVPVMIAFLTELQAAIQPGSDGDVLITAAERNHLLTLPLPSNITLIGATKLVDRFAQITAGTLPEQDFDLQALLKAAESLKQTLDTLLGRGWTTTYDAFFRGVTQPFQAEDQSLAGQLQVAKPLSYRLFDISAPGQTQYGQLNLLGTFDNLILNAFDMYQIDYVDLDTFYVGHTVFQATGNAENTTIPRTSLSPPDSKDSDHDGLPDEVELILGTNPYAADTDGDGVSDAAEVAAGTNPLVGDTLPLGIVGVAATSTPALQIAVSGGIALVAQGVGGLVIYSVDSPQPSLVASFQLSGNVNAVAFAGTRAIVTTGRTGLAVVDVSDPFTPRISRYIGVNNAVSDFTKVVTAGNLAYAITGESLYLIDLAKGLVLDERPIDLTVEQAVPQDVAISGDFVYLLTGHVRTYSLDKPGEQHLHKIRIDSVIGSDVSTLNLAGTNYTSDVPTRLAVVPGIVYITGLNTSQLPSTPGLFIVGDTTNGLQILGQSLTPGAQCLAANGSGTVLVGSLTNLVVLDVRNPQLGGVISTNFSLPTRSRSIALALGRAYVADDTSGLQVINYYSPDTNGVAPSIGIGANFSLDPAVAPPSQTVVVSAAVGDDVQVRSVEFYLNGVLESVVGSSPFDFWFVTPSLTNATQVALRARAIDTGGNSTWTDVINVALSESATPPSVTNTVPIPKAVLQPGLSSVQASFSKSLDATSVSQGSLQVVSAGPDGALDTTDDQSVPGTVIYQGGPSVVAFQPASPFAVGDYRATISTSIADTNGNHLLNAYTWTFSIKTAVFWNTNAPGAWSLGTNWSTGSVPIPNDFVVIDQTNGLDTVTFASGTAAIDSLQSTEPLLITGGTFSMARSSWVSNDVTLSGGYLNVADYLDVAGTFSFGSKVDGGGTISADSGLDIGSQSARIGAISIINKGHASWHQPDNSGLIIDSPVAGIFNAAGGVFETHGRSFAYFQAYNPPYAHFDNEGLFHVLSGPGQNGTIFQGVTFNNRGIVDIETGTLDLTGIGGVSSGSFAVAAGANVEFESDNHLTSSSSIQGAGSVGFKSGIIIIDGSYDIAGSTILDGNANVLFNGPVKNLGSVQARAGIARFSGATVNASGPMVLGGGILQFNNFGGQITPSSVTITNGGILWGTADITILGPLLATNGAMWGAGRTISTAPSVVGNIMLYSFSGLVQPRSVDNHSTMTMVADIGGGQATIHNFPGATFDCVGDFRIFADPGNVGVAVLNEGLLQKSAGSGQFVIDLPVHNVGLTESISGDLAFNGGFVQSGGELRLAGGGYRGANFEIQAGLVTGSGSFTLYQFNNTGGTVSPGLPGTIIGTLHLTYQYNQGAGGVLAIDIANASAGGFDQLNADGPAVLAGTLKITVSPSYQPVIGDVFRILTCSQRTGTFASITGGGLGVGMKLAATYDATGVTLTVVAAP